MKVSTKGQVTIPLEVMEKIGIKLGSNVEFIIENGGAVLRKTDTMTRGELLIQRMTGAGTGKMTTDEIMAMTRGED